MLTRRNNAPDFWARGCTGCVAALRSRWPAAFEDRCWFGNWRQRRFPVLRRCSSPQCVARFTGTASPKQPGSSPFLR